MANIFNEDFRNFLNAPNKQGLRYLFVGGYSVILHGYECTTGDMDIWVERINENYHRLIKAFEQFEMPVFDTMEDNFPFHPNWEVFTFGNPPVAIDIMVQVKGLEFSSCFEKSVVFEDDDLKIRTIHKNDLIAAKKKCGTFQRSK